MEAPRTSSAAAAAVPPPPIDETLFSDLEGGVFSVERAKRILDQQANAAVRGKITGIAGVGKSSLINTLRDLPPDHPDCARVGENEDCTKMDDVRDYPFPSAPNILLGDLPGAGTAMFPYEGYWDRMGLSAAHFVLLLSADRFREEELKVGRRCQEEGIPFIFVRTRIDETIRNAARRGISEAAAVQAARASVERQLHDASLRPSGIFVVSAHHEDRFKWDLEPLKECLLRSLPALQKRALLLHMRSCSRAVLEQKKQLCYERLPLYCALSAAGAAVPIPGTSILVDTGLCATMLAEFKATMGIDSAHLDLLLRAATPALQLVLQSVERALLVLGTQLGILLAESVVEETLSAFLPIFGSLIAAALSASTMYFMGHRLIITLHEQAICVSDAVIQQARLHA